MHVLVTGGAGFIGSHLIRKLREKKQNVIATDNHSNCEAVSKRREKELEKDRAVEVYGMDIMSAKGLLDSLGMRYRREGIIKEGEPAVNAIVHLAAPLSVEESIRNPLKYCKEIEGNTISLLDAVKAGNIKRIIIASTAAVYGNTDCMPISENANPDPRSPYAISNLAAEQTARMYAREYCIEAVILRLFNVYGPDQDPASQYSGVITRYFQQARKNEPLIIFGDGNQTRDFVYVDDVCDAIIAALTKPVTPGSVFNIGSGNEASITYLAGMIQEITRARCGTRNEPARKGDILRSQAAIQRAKEVLGYEPKTSLEEGLKATWAYFNAHYQPQDKLIQKP